MKKILAIATAAFALSACGNEAPTVEEPAMSSSDQAEWTMWEIAWGEFTTTEHDNACGLWNWDQDKALELLNGAVPDSNENVTIAFFDSKC